MSNIPKRKEQNYRDYGNGMDVIVDEPISARDNIKIFLQFKRKKTSI